MAPASRRGLRPATGLALIVALLEFVSGIRDCYDAHRREYVGNSTELATCTDCKCLPWPPEYGYPENFCRIVDGLDIPRCLVDNYLGVHLEDCNVPSCDVHATCYHGDGSDYRDGGQFTESGYQCLQWDNVQERGVNSTVYPWADLQSNFCRNPNGESRPWCFFAANGTVQRGWCAIAQCASESALSFDQLQLHTLAWDPAAEAVRTLSFKPARFTVEGCLEACAGGAEFKCRSVAVDNLRRSCLLTDANQFFVGLVASERFDLYLRKDTVCDVFEFTDFGQTECLLPMGVEVGSIQDAQFSASSNADDDHAPWAGRLNGPSSWMPDPAEADASPFLQIDFLKRVKVTGLSVQGGGSNDSFLGNWVEEFSVLVTHDPVGGAWDRLGVYTDTVTELGPVVPEVFRANKEPNCIQTILFDEAVHTRYLRINPTKWHGQVALRVEIIGCQDDGCDNSLGLINGRIADGQLEVSDFSRPDCAEAAARLDPFQSVPSCGWKPDAAHYSAEPTLTVRLGRPHAVTSVVAQGCADGRVTSLRVGHGDADSDPAPVPDEISAIDLIGGSSQATYLYRHKLRSPIECTVVYVTVLEWVGTACLKIELVGCLALSGCRRRLGMESGRIADYQLSTAAANRTGPALPATSATPRLHHWAGLSSGWNLGGGAAAAGWLQIDLLTSHTVTGFAVQAGRDHQYSLWVDAYVLRYAADATGSGGPTAETWKPYVDKAGKTLAFRGTHSPYAVSRHKLDRSFITSKIRIVPESWSSLYAGLRAEVIGCELADRGDFCSEDTTAHGGLCLGVANGDAEGTCDAAFAHRATRAVIHSAGAQQAISDLLRDSELPTYLIGLRESPGPVPRYTWVDGSGLTYSNFGPADPTLGRFNSSQEACVKINTAEGFRWESTYCVVPYINSRGTVCQYDLDECAGNHGCSHGCLNYPGGYQCQCPTGYVLDSTTRQECISVCSYHQETNSTWLQRGNWCYTEGVGNATWHFANTACLSLRAGSRLPALDDAFWTEFGGMWNLTWVSRDEANPSFRQDILPVFQNSSFETDCIAADLSDEPFSVAREWVGSCNLSLPYVCIMEFASLEDPDAERTVITTDTPVGYFRSWRYPPHSPSSAKTRTVLQFNLPENYTVRFDISYLSIPETGDCRENFFNISEILPGNYSLQRAFFCGTETRGMSVTGSRPGLEAVLNVSSLYPRQGDPSAVGVETVFTVVECASNCRSNCGSSPSVLTNATGSFGILPGTPVDAYTSCRWLVSVEQGAFVRLRLSEYELSDRSRVSVVYGSVSEGDYSAYDVEVGGFSEPIFIADTNEVTVFLSTTGVLEESGFWMDYDSVDAPGCSVGHTPASCLSDAARTCLVACSYPGAYVASQSYQGGRWTFAVETWHLDTPPGTYVEIVFEEMSIASARDGACTDGYIKLEDPADPSDPDTIVERLCDAKPFGNSGAPGAVRSQQNRVWLELYAAPGDRFLARYAGLRFQPARPVVVTGRHCDAGWFYFDKHCYQLGDAQTKLRWGDANATCAREHAHLVSIRSRDESEFVHYMLTTEWLTTKRKTYIGLTHRDGQGVFTWSDGSPMSYTDWALRLTEVEKEEEDERFEYNSPNGGVLEGCTMIELDDVGTSANWVDVACAAREAYQYLCKRRARDFIQPQPVGSFVGQDNPRQCPPDLFQCATGECIQRIFLCDSADDCSDGSDEGAVCSSDYTRFRYKCDMQDIPVSYLCDFVADCDHGLDENNCFRPDCDETQFRCQNGQCANATQRCDLTYPCPEDRPAEDDVCQKITGGFQCYNSQWIPSEYQCDTYPDCGVLHYEDEMPCYDKYVASCADEGLIQCRSGICVSENHTCIRDFDRHGYIKGCRDVTHLIDCESFQCPRSTFKCPASYCIPISHRCNGVFDCPNKEDEMQCDTYACPGAYRCRNHAQCVSPEQLCDGQPDCSETAEERGGDDELFCDARCPTSCHCVGLSYVCEGVGWGPGTAGMISTNVRQLFLNSLSLKDHQDTGSMRQKRDGLPAWATVTDLLFLSLQDYPFLIDLELKENGIKELIPGMFNNSHNLRTLDLSLNNIDVLRSGTFEGLSSLERLSLSGNSLRSIEVGAFDGLSKLKVLEILDISPIKSSEGFVNLESLETIVASKYLYCCVKESVDCVAPRDQFSDCRDLISNGALRFFMWLLGLSALAGNAVVFGLRVVKTCRAGCSGSRRDATPVQSFLITNLAASDFLMGVYMIIVAGADVHFRDEYAFRAEAWRSGLACKIAGVLSILSSEVSVFVVMLLSLDRFFKIVFPFRFGLHLTERRAQWLVLVSWVVGLLMCLIPAVVTVYFTGGYYGSSSVCLALPLVPELPQGWQYMFFLLGVNLVCFLVMLGCYAAIFVAVKRSSRRSRGGSAQSAAEVRVAAKLALIVGTDFVCWMPIIILALLGSFGGVDVAQQVYAWIAIFVLPLNSSINPYLYTLSNFWGRRSKSQRSKKGHSSNSLIRNQGYSPSPVNRTRSSDLGVDGFTDSHSGDFELQPTLKTVLSQLEQHRILPVVHREPSRVCRPPAGGSSNGAVAVATSAQDEGSSPTGGALSERDMTRIADDVTTALSWLHANGISGIHLNEDSVVLEENSSGQQRAHLKLPQSILGGEAPNRKLLRSRDSTNDIGVELDNKALENMIGRIRNNSSIC